MGELFQQQKNLPLSSGGHQTYSAIEGGLLSLVTALSDFCCRLLSLQIVSSQQKVSESWHCIPT